MQSGFAWRFARVTNAFKKLYERYGFEILPYEQMVLERTDEADTFHPAGGCGKMLSISAAPFLYIGGHYANPAMRAINVTSMQAAIPVSVGIRKAAAVHFQLPVSL